MKAIRVLRTINKIILVGLFLYLTLAIFFAVKGGISPKNSSTTYVLPWPGILPDNVFYKVKVLRNKIIERIIVDPVKKVEYDLLMADKTIYASELLVEKGEVQLAKDTALKGENYYSMLVQDYNTSLLKQRDISDELNKRILRAAIKHQEIFKELEQKVVSKDKEAFVAARTFSTINYNFIIGFHGTQK